MPWCPECKVEYRDGFTVCSDCGSFLDDECPEDLVVEDKKSHDKPALLTEASDSVEADMITAMLKSAGIRTMQKPKEAGTYLNVYMGTTVFGVEIYVAAEDLERAKELTEVYFSDNESADTEEPKKAERYKVSKVSGRINKSRSPVKNTGNDFDKRRRIMRIVILAVLIPSLILGIISGVARIFIFFSLW